MKLNVNWKEVGERFDLTAKQAHVRYDALELKHLDKWNACEIEKMRAEMHTIYRAHKSMKSIKQLLDEKFHFSSQYWKQGKQIDNLISHEFARLDLE